MSKTAKGNPGGKVNNNMFKPDGQKKDSPVHPYKTATKNKGT